MRHVRLVIMVTALVCVSMYGCRFAAKPEYPQGPSMTAYQLRKHVTHLSQTIGVRNYAHYDKLQQAAQYIEQEFLAMGYEVESQWYSVDGKSYRNIIASRPAAFCARRPLIVGAHYDSCHNPGADDNASGVAGMLELARLLKDDPSANRLKFIAFVNEEPPFFMTKDMGSFVYARRLKGNADQILGAVILESIGYYSERPNSQRYFPGLGLFYPNKGNFIAMVSNIASRKLLARLKSRFENASSFPVESIVVPSFIPGFNFSDHWSFWKNGFPAIMVTDTAFLRNNNYHQNSDLPHTLDYEKMTQLILGLKSALSSN